MLDSERIIFDWYSYEKTVFLQVEKIPYKASEKAYGMGKYRDTLFSRVRKSRVFDEKIPCW